MKIKVLLLQNVTKIGNKGDIVEVSDAYARNVLIKQWLAKIADKKTIRNYEKQRQKKLEEQQEILKKKQAVIEDMKLTGLEIIVSASVDGHLYEKIDLKHIKKCIFEKYKIKFSDKEIDFPDKKVNKLGEYEFYVIYLSKKIKLKLKVLTKKL